MPIKDVCSPVSRPGSKVGSNQPLSPGAQSSPSRARATADSVPAQPRHAARASHSSDPGEGAQTKVVGPDE
jgi:hypothetical protein